MTWAKGRAIKVDKVFGKRSCELCLDKEFGEIARRERVLSTRLEELALSHRARPYSGEL